MKTHLPITKGSGDVEGVGAKVILSSEEKQKLLEQYGCESDEEEYPWGGGLKFCFTGLALILHIVTE